MQPSAYNNYVHLGAHPNYMGMIEHYQKSGEDLLTIDFIDAPAHADPHSISIPLSFAGGALQMLVKPTADFEAWFSAFAAQEAACHLALKAARSTSRPRR